MKMSIATISVPLVMMLLPFWDLSRRLSSDLHTGKQDHQISLRQRCRLGDAEVLPLGSTRIDGSELEAF